MIYTKQGVSETIPSICNNRNSNTKVYISPQMCCISLKWAQQRDGEGSGVHTGKLDPHIAPGQQYELLFFGFNFGI
jgi:hypothetical protein